MSKSRPILPAPVDRTYAPFQVSGAGTWLVLSDVHIPYHDTRTVELAIDTAVKERVAGVLLNGDIMDVEELGSWDKDPRGPKYLAELRMTKEFLSYLRQRLRAIKGKSARILYKVGNHEERIDRYLIKKSPALYGLESLELPAVLEMKSYGVEFIGGRRVVRLGKLSVIHGHEYRNTIQAPVNPARGLFNRAHKSAMCGHFHQTSEHHEPSIDGSPIGCWSTGCACHLQPDWCPLNKWNHGFAIVEVDKGGVFSVRNLRVMSGEVV